MDIKSKIFKRKSGKEKGRWIIRVSYFDDSSGRLRQMERGFDRRTEAIDARELLIADLKKSHGQSPHGDRMTFDMLADRCEEVFYKPAVIVSGRKIAGIRSVDKVRSQIRS